MTFACPSIRAKGSEADWLRRGVSGDSAGGFWEDSGCDRRGQPGHAGHQVHPGWVTPADCHTYSHAQIHCCCFFNVAFSVSQCRDVRSGANLDPGPQPGSGCYSFGTGYLYHWLFLCWDSCAIATVVIVIVWVGWAKMTGSEIFTQVMFSSWEVS